MKTIKDYFEMIYTHLILKFDFLIDTLLIVLFLLLWSLLCLNEIQHDEVFNHRLS